MRAAVSLRSPESSLQALIGLMIESGPWTAGSICLLTAGGRLETAAFLDARAAEGDRLQAEFGEGPSNDALRDEPVRWSVDLAGETRWTRWSPAVAALGFRSTLAVRLFTDTTLGTVNLYATRAGQLDPTDMCAAQVTAAHVSVVVAAISTERHLRRAMWSRNVIGQAQGMLMQRNGLTADQALEFLRRQSQQRNLKLVALAGQITGTGIPPIIDGPG
jgi:hypothetical protein